MEKDRILYPCYFNAALGRAQGRRVPLVLAQKGVTMQELERALRRSRLPFRIEPGSHPAHWYRRDGRAVVAWSGSKEALLRRVAAALEQKK
ncbi:MAG TPA: signal recognition particle subunit SRP19/SEC65 family protein [Methanoregulaceae archaeon]|jgi:signal recognition particle subunit SRP19|nr:signal recognition particle subunit SRP19/SEC65 family protein [Methanoregulaceae archaeon]HOV67577.1 signal recognition particle subunit SRP19/SEC65 family protein [Methanoregulaceae archaeon]HQJ88846.1 signal recognition particle subunit SRP19/SEC65 family protein [Methanoregulaceae archaeon]